MVRFYSFSNRSQCSRVHSKADSVCFQMNFYFVNCFSFHFVWSNLAGGMQGQRDINLNGSISFIFQLFSMFRSAFKIWQSLLANIGFILSSFLVSISFNSIFLGVLNTLVVLKLLIYIYSCFSVAMPSVQTVPAFRFRFYFLNRWSHYSYQSNY